MLERRAWGLLRFGPIMASRKEQKRREREEREAAAKAVESRRRLIGYGAGAVLVLAAVVIALVLLAGSRGGESGGGNRSADSGLLPDGGEVPARRIEDLDEAAEAASCEVTSKRAGSREHIEDINEQVKYDSNPPTSGRHYIPPAPDDGAYEDPPRVIETVHSLEHGRIVVWFKKKLPEEARASLQAFFEEDDYHMVLVPEQTNMPFDVAATAWNIDPEPNGTGRLLGCREYSPGVFDALRAFRDEHRDNGPENVP